MRTIEVKRIAPPAGAEDAGRALDRAGVEFHTIDCVNWEDTYPFMPDVRFRIAHTGDSIVVQFRVSEPTVRAVAPGDNGRVWEDSCVEFFMENPGGKGYVNVECNCVCTLLVASGSDREHRAPLSPEQLAAIDRHATLGREPFPEREAPEVWEASLVIPADTFGIADLSGRELRANFYKCGDLLATPHFLSWNPVTSPVPNFHLPASFGLLRFDQGVS